MKKLPHSRLIQYRTIEDLWQDTLRPWLIEASSQSLTGVPYFLVLHQLAQVHWIQTRALQENIALFGVQFLDRDSLRWELRQHFNLTQPSFTREFLEFLLKLKTSKLEDSFSRSITLNATAYCDAIEELFKANWEPQEAVSFSLPLMQWIQTLEKNQLGNIFLDKQLLQHAQSSHPTIRLAVVGWDAEFLPELFLLRAVCALSQKTEICVPMPRITEEDADVLWIKALEETFQITCETSRDSGFETQNSALAENLFLNQNHLSLIDPPQLFLAKHSTHQTQIIFTQLNSIIQKNDSLTQPIGIIFPQATPSQIELMEIFDKYSILYRNEIIQFSEPNITCQLQLAIIDYLKNQCHIEKLISLIEILNDFDNSPWPKLDPVLIKKRFYYIFSSLPTSNTSLLAEKLRLKNNSLDTTLNRLLQTLTPWTEKTTWEEAKTQWNKLLSVFHLPASWEYYLPDTFPKYIAKEPFSTDLFFDFLTQLLTSEKIRFPLRKNASFSPLIITSFSQALNRTWSHLIFAECNESSWPIAPEENPFLNDSIKRQWNQSQTSLHSYLLTTTSHFLLQQRRFLDIIEHCEKSVTLISNQGDLSQALPKRFPNEWFRQCYHLWPHCLSELPELALVKPDPNLVHEIAHFTQIHGLRQNPNYPFDEFCFNLKELNLEIPWEASKLDEATLYPATFAFHLIWQTESIQTYQFSTNHSKTVGAWTHQWIRYILQKMPTSPKSWHKKECLNVLDQIHQTFLQETAQVLKVKELSLWWTTLIERTHWATKKCLLTLLEITPNYSHFSSGLNSVSNYNLDSQNKLNLKTTCELLLSQEEHPKKSLHFIHFKVGKFKKLNFTHLEENQGLRLAANLVHSRGKNYESITVSGITPSQGLISLLTQEDWEKILPSFRKVSLLQKNPIFAIKGLLHHSRQKTEKLPLATRSIPESILKDKYNISMSEQTLEPTPLN